MGISGTKSKAKEDNMKAKEDNMGKREALTGNRPGPSNTDKKENNSTGTTIDNLLHNLEKKGCAPAKSELFTGHKPIPLKIAMKVMKSICKITIKTKKALKYGTGFFLSYSDSSKYLITNYHVINENMKKNDIEIEIWNHKTMKLKLEDRYIKYFPQPKDITLIKVKEKDEIYKDIEFLDYDSNYTQKGYIIYKDADVFTVEHPFGKDASCASGTIIKINEYEFDHNISTDVGSSGCPIILLNDNIYLIQVIGIHKNANYNDKINGGTFIGEIFNEINKEKEDKKDKILKENNNNNYIEAEIYITKKNINKDIRIINSYEEYARTRKDRDDLLKDDIFKNEGEIKKCQIKINKKIVPFNYKYKFKSNGKYKIKYAFNQYISKTVFLFGECDLLTNIDLSNFNTENVTNMNSMFYGCSSLTHLNLSNFNTENVTDIGCMFDGCSSLTNLNLSDFNTEKVTNMSGMFHGCSSLTNLNLSNFNTENVTTMNGMFYGCSSLTNLNLSNFSTENVTNMNGMFYGCSSLTNLNLSNFNTENVTNMNSMFAGCKSLKIKNIIIKDKKIFNDNNVFGRIHFSKSSKYRLKGISEGKITLKYIKVVESILCLELGPMPFNYDVFQK